MGDAVSRCSEGNNKGNVIKIVVMTSTLSCSMDSLIVFCSLTHSCIGLDRHGPQRIRPLRENNLPVLPVRPLPRHPISTFQGSGAGAFLGMVINYVDKTGWGGGQMKFFLFGKGGAEKVSDLQFSHFVAPPPPPQPGN